MIAIRLLAICFVLTIIESALAQPLQSHRSSIQAKLIAHTEPSDELQNSIGMKLVLIHRGTFTMGSPETEIGRRENEKQHQVTLTKDFYMGATEVTQGQWESLMGSAPWRESIFLKEGTNYPAMHVNWDDAVEFCKKLSKKENKSYRLPTEAEWEYACRAGSKSAYSFGDSPEDLNDYGWWGGLLDIGNAKSEQYAHMVMQKKPNAFGLYDMHGNVFEWCADWQGNYPSDPVVDPKGPSAGDVRVFRGGGWYAPAFSCRSAYRSGIAPWVHSYTTGFRVVQDLPGE